MTDATQRTPQAENGRVETSHHPRTDPERETHDYYGIPPIKEHTWTWEVPVYFWLGGIGAGAHVVTTIARLLGHDDRAFLRAGRYTTLVAMILSPILLIMDLGRPERFLNMLRILKLRSPMSTGSWALSVPLCERMSLEATYYHQQINGAIAALDFLALLFAWLAIG